MPGSRLLIHPNLDQDEYVRVSPSRAGWDLLHFAARRLTEGERWLFETGGNEYGLVVLGGTCSVASSSGSWDAIGGREHVFEGMPHCLYFSRNAEVEITALSPQLDLAYGWCATEEDHPARLITPEQVSVEIRGGGNATRQINSMIPPGFDCQRLVAVEVYTPSGNWSSYPPHKHDEHRVNDAGELLEADLEEIYFYKLDPPEGFAIQRVYTGNRHLDEVLVAHDDHLVLVPEGYHPVVSAHGYTTYYLNFLAGSAQSLANTDDPKYAWVKGSWREVDPRLPIVSLDMQ